ncbi:MAG: hypothetical protein ABI481_04825 [Pyrinomonadaceae bacterium]
MKNLLIGLLFLLVSYTFTLGQIVVLKPKDLKLLEGKKWTGTLTYLDYTSNKRTSIRSNLTVARKTNKPATWAFSYEYPDEAKANKLSEAVLSDDGKTFFGERVIAKTHPNRKALMLVTTQPGSDNNKKAVFRYTYLVDAKNLSLKKEVQVEGSSVWFLRNEYILAR